MPQDFSGQNLRGRSFKGQNLSGADFSRADIRGADFTNALLIGANFRGAKAGLQRRWKISLLIISLLIAAIGGFTSAFALPQVFTLLPSIKEFTILPAVVFLVVFAIFLIVTIYQGLEASFWAVAGAGAGAVIAATVMVGGAAGAVAAAAVTAGAGAGASVGAVALAMAVAVVMAGAGAVALAVAMAVAMAGAVAGAGAAVGAGAVVGVSAYIGWHALTGEDKYTTVRRIALAFAAMGGTSFRGANLTDADFTSATLKSTDFRSAILTRTCWHQAKKLNLVQAGTTYLRNVKLLQWLIGNGQDKNFDDRQDLRGVYLKGANLVDASFINADLSQANLQNADLFRAKLVQTRLDETDLTGATLTGAYIEDWGITSHTKLGGVRCEYVFMRQPTKEDPNPQRKPDNWEENFEDGDFADFIKPIVDTLDLYHNQGVDPRAIAISFKQLAEKHPDAALEIAAMEKRGRDKLLIRAKTSHDADKSKLSAEYFSTYNQFKGLSEQEMRLLLIEKNIRLEEKDSQIGKLESMINTALQPPDVYSETHIHNNVQGNSNRILQGNNNQAVLGNNNQV